MRILVHDYAGHAFPASLSRELAARGHEVVHAFAGALQTPRGDLSRHAGDPATLAFREIAMDPDYPRHKYSFWRRRGMEVRYGRAAADFVRQWRPQAVLSGNTPTETQEPLLRATLDSGGRFYYWVQDFYSLAVDRLLRARLPVLGAAIGAWYRRLDRSQFRRSAGIVAITEDFAPILTAEFGVDPTVVRVIPNWAVLDDLPIRPRDNPWSRGQGLERAFTFLYSGTIGMKHNPALLLELARRFREDPAVQVVVVSEGIGADWLRRESAAAQLTNLRVLPYQPFADLPDVLASGDVLLGILEEEAGVFSVPSKTLSYLCAGRPLLLSVPPANLAARITAGHQAGVVVAPRDLEGWLAAAERLRQDSGSREQLGRNARAYAEQHFAIGRIADGFEQLMSRLAANGSPSR
jgi:glycosyltransferase involved in cell wall biosynthesis